MLQIDYRLQNTAQQLISCDFGSVHPIYQIAHLQGSRVLSNAQIESRYGDRLMSECKQAVASWETAAAEPGVATPAVRQVAEMARIEFAKIFGAE